MKNDHKTRKRLLALMLSLALTITYMPTYMFAYAVDDGTSVDAATVEDAENTDSDAEGLSGAATDSETTDVNVPENEEPSDVTEGGDEAEGSDTPQLNSTTGDGNIKLTAEFKAGATLRDGHWVKSVENQDARQQFQYHISVDVNREVYSQYKAGSLRITIPYSILKHMKHNGTYYCPPNTEDDNSVNSCILDGSVVKKSAVTDSDDWYYETVTENGKRKYVIVNNKDLSNIDANTVEFDIIYQTTYSSYAYADYDNSSAEALAGCASNPFDVHLEATNESGAVTTADEQAPEVYIDTTAVLKEVTKTLNTTWEGTVEDEQGNETNYLYLCYEVKATVMGAYTSSLPTQQFMLTFDDGYNGAFSNVLADYTDDGVSDTDYELVGYCEWASSNPSDYTIDKGSYLTAWNPSTNYIYRYVLIRVEKPDSLTINYTLDNTVKVTLKPLGGSDASTVKRATAKFSEYYKNTAPLGRFMIHKWGNNNYDAARHSRTDAYGNFTAYQVKWGHQNNELDLFKSGQIDVLRGFRYFTWYEGYSVRYTDYKEPHEMTYSFEDEDIGIGFNINHDSNFTSGNLSSNTYNDVTKTALDAGDYYFSEVDFYPEAQNATYDTEKEKWVITKSGNPFKGDEPIIIYARFGSKTAAWTKVAEVKYSKKYDDDMSDAVGTVTWYDSSLVDVSFGTYEGEKYNTEDTGFIIKFKNDDCVGYRIVNTNDHYYFMCNVKPTVNLKGNWVRGMLKSKGTNYCYIENIADMNVYDDTVKSDDNKDGLLFNFAKDAAEGGHLANRIAASAAVDQNNLLDVNKHFCKSVQDIGNQMYTTSWLINARAYCYGGICPVGVTYPKVDEILESGTFFDILPRGAEVDESSIKVYKVQLAKESYSKTQANDSEFDSKYLVDPSNYTVDVITGSYNGHSLNGLTLLKITVNEPVYGYKEGETDTTYSAGYTAVFNTTSYYEDLDLYGNTLLNAVAFESSSNRTYHENGFPDDPRKTGHTRHPNSSKLLNISDSHPDREAVLDALTDLDPATASATGYRFGYDFDSVTVYYNQYNVSGLSKRVKLADESTWGISREVEPGGQYQYRLRYATDSKTTASDIILYDKIEGYTDEAKGVKSDWYGTLNSMKLEFSDGTSPTVKYYISTKDDAVTGDAIDLTDTSTWTEVSAGDDLSSLGAKWVAADTKGYTLGTNSSMSLILTMTAPASNSSNKAWPTTYNDSHAKGIQQEGTSSEEGAEFSNVSNQTQVIYTLTGKVMIEKVDEEGKPIADVTFTLEGTSSLVDENGDHAEVSMTAVTDSEGHAVFKNVPISGTGYYTLSEETPDGYMDEGTTWKVEITEDTKTLIDGKDSTGVYFRIVNKESAEVTVEKSWLTARGTTTAPTGAKVTLTLYADGEPTDETVVLDGTKDSKQEGKAGYEYEKWKAKFTGIPKYKTGVFGTETEIKYTVVETSGWPGYTVSYGDDGETSAANGGVITNTEETIELTANKAWLGLDGSTEPPEGAKITFALRKPDYIHGGYIGLTNSYKVELDGITDAEPEGYGGYESSPWTATFKKVPKYEIVNGEAVEIEYTIYELNSWEDYNGTGIITPGGTITNKRVSTSVKAYKRWKRADMTTKAPEGAKVILTLYADGEPTDFSVTLDGTADEAPEDQGGYEVSAWQAEFVNMPYYKMVDGTRVRIVYTVVETEGWEGFTASPESVSNNGLIYNTEESTELTADKKWLNLDGTDTPPAGAKVTFTLCADGVELTSKKVVLDGEVDATAYYNGYEYEAWKAKFGNLPKYSYSDGEATEIVYTVKETVTWPGYAPDNENVSTGGTITNKQETTDISVTKAWKNADGTTTAPNGGKATFTLYADGAETGRSVTLDGTQDEANGSGYESADWVAMFPDLQKYKVVNGKAVEIAYTVKETGTWRGYVVSYGDDGETYAVDDGVITNIQATVSTDLDVSKTLTGRDFAEDDAFTFTVTGAVKDDGSASAPMPAYNSVTIYPDEDDPDSTTASFGTITYTTADAGKTYVYTITETVPAGADNGTLDGVTYDTEARTVTVKVIENEDGTLSIERTPESTTTGFTNVYTASGSAEFEVEKTLVGRTFLGTDAWTFTLTPANDSTPMPLDEGGNRISPYVYTLDSSSGITAGQTTAKFKLPEIKYTLADAGETYTYTITESGEVAGVTNSTTVYTVTVTVVDNGDGTLGVTEKYTYPKEFSPVVFPAGKTIAQADEGSGTTLSSSASAASAVTAGAAALSSAAETASGSLISGGGAISGGGSSILPIDDTFEPVNPDWPGGTIKPFVVTTKNAAFTNVYSEEGKAAVAVTKSMNVWSGAESFKFVLTPANDTSPIVVGETSYSSLTATASSDSPTAAFGQLKFEKAGTYYYYINEVVPDDAVNADGVTYSQATDEQKAEGGFTLNGVTYDSSTHYVTITMTGNNDSNLYATIEYDGEEATVCSIVNTYTASGKTEFEGKKTIEGRTFLGTDTWAFTLTPANDSTPMPLDEDGNRISPYVFDLTGDNGITAGQTVAEFTFGEIEYTQDDIGKTYTYYISESGEVGGVTNSTRVYTVKVTIADNGNGTLNITKEYSYKGFLEPEIIDDGHIKPLSAGASAVLSSASAISSGASSLSGSTGTVSGGAISGGTGTVSGGKIPGGEVIKPDWPVRPRPIPTEKAEFTNTYAAEGTATIEVTKSIEDWGTTSQFWFVLTPVDNAPMPDGWDDGAYATEDDPTAVFSDITYSMEGTYQYKITEFIPDDAVNAAGKRWADATADEKAAGGFMYNNVVYDSNAYTVTVTAAENTPKDGTLKTTVTYGDDNEKSLTITNTVKSKLLIRKTLDGYVDAGADSNVTIAFRIVGYRSETNANGDAAETVVYSNYGGMVFSKGDDLSKLLTYEDLPYCDRIVVTEVYSGNYTPEGGNTELEAVYDPKTGIWEVEFKNNHSGYTPGSGIVNKYEDGNYAGRDPGGTAPADDSGGDEEGHEYNNDDNTHDQL